MVSYKRMDKLKYIPGDVLILVVVEDGLILNGDISKWDVRKVS